MAGDGDILGCVQEALANYDYETAEFIVQQALHLAGKESKAPAALRVALAEVFIGQRRYRIVTQNINLLDSERGQYLKAQAHFELGEISEARLALLHSIRRDRPNVDELSVDQIPLAAIPNKAYGWRLLGECVALNVFEDRSLAPQAAICFKNALRLNPLLYSALAGLIRIGQVPAGHRLPSTVRHSSFLLSSPSSHREIDTTPLLDGGSPCPPSLPSMETPVLSHGPSPLTSTMPPPPPGTIQWHTPGTVPNDSVVDSIIGLRPSTDAPPQPLPPMDGTPAGAGVRAPHAPGMPSVAAVVDTVNRAWPLLELYGGGEFALVVSAFADMPATLRDSPFLLHLVGMAYFHCARYLECVEAFRRLRARSPHFRPLTPFAEALWVLQRADLLNSLAHELVTVDPGGVDGLVAVALSCSLSNNSAAAQENLAKAIRRSPGDGALHRLLGQERLDSNQVAEAQRDLQRAITINERDYSAWVGIGNIYMRSGAYPDAVRCYLAGLRLNRSSPTILAHLGIAYSSYGRRDNAMKALQDAIAIDPECVTALYHLAKLEAEDPSLADTAMSRLEFVSQRHRSVNVHVLLGELMFRKGRVDDAVGQVDAALELDPRSHVAQDLLQKISACKSA